MLSGRVQVSGYGTRVPVRVERLDGSAAALVVAGPDGSWEVDVPAGTYVVRERWTGRVYEATVAYQAPAAAPSQDPGTGGSEPSATAGSPGREELSAMLARRRARTSDAVAATADSSRPARVPRDGGRRGGGRGR